MFLIFNPSKILIRSTFTSFSFFPIGRVVLNPLHNMLRIIVSTIRLVYIQSDTARTIRIIPLTRFFVLVIHSIVWGRVIIYESFDFIKYFGLRWWRLVELLNHFGIYVSCIMERLIIVFLKRSIVPLLATKSP